MSPSSTASVKNRGPAGVEAVRQGRLRAEAFHSRVSRHSRGVGSRRPGRCIGVCGRRGGRRHRHQQGTWLFRGHEAAQFLRPAGHPRREEVPPPLGGTGCSAYPSRMFKGKKMPGQYGSTACTMRNLKVVQVDAENNLLLVRGAVPGPNGGYVMIRKPTSCNSLGNRATGSPAMASLKIHDRQRQRSRDLRDRPDRFCAAHQ